MSREAIQCDYSWGLLSFVPQTNLRVSRKRLHLLQSSLNRFSRTSQTLCHWHLGLGWGIKGREESTCGSTCSILDSESVYFFMPSFSILSCSSNHASFTLPSATLFIHGCTRTEDGLYSLTPISRTLSPSVTMWGTRSELILAVSLLAQLFPLHAPMLP